MESVRYTARSLYVIYRQLPKEEQRAFKEILIRENDKDYHNDEWLHLSERTLQELWDDPEEDYWDELYDKQHKEN